MQNIGSGNQIDTVYTDLKAACDRLKHSILLAAKLGKLEVSARLIVWLRSYLCNRKLAVKISSSVSDWFTNGSGVPQGSNLSPLLFSIFFNDVVICIGESCCILYADDMKIYVVVEDSSDFKIYLIGLVNWCRANKMTLSVPKYTVISFQRKKKTAVLHDYVNGDEVLLRVNSVRDLGVILDNELTFKENYEEMIKKAIRQLGLVSNITNEFRDPYKLKSLYVSMIHPLFTTIDRIEAVQRKFCDSP